MAAAPSRRVAIIPEGGLGRTSLTEDERAERLGCADGPLWIVHTEPA